MPGSGSYIYFSKLIQQGKTQRWAVRTRSRDDLLGTIKFYGAWRQYVFFPESQVIFSAGCLDQISKFIQDAQEAWKHQVPSNFSTFPADGWPIGEGHNEPPGE